jgi:hypothetical protein
MFTQHFNSVKTKFSLIVVRKLKKQKIYIEKIFLRDISYSIFNGHPAFYFYDSK